MATYAFLCPTPKENCCGTLAKLNGSLDKRGIKKHGSPESAMQCYRKYLVDVVGCVQISSREFRRPEGGIEFLSKASRFGARLRAGKRGEGGSIGAANRGMPLKHGGVVVTT